jgi:hypothetical protein
VDTRTAAKRTATVLAETADFLQEFDRKRSLYYERFGSVLTVIETFAESITDQIARRQFLREYVALDDERRLSTPDDALKAPSVENLADPILQRLLQWFAVARPLTGLARTYVSEILKVGPEHTKSYSAYLAEVEAVKATFAAYRFPISAEPPENPSASAEGVAQFLTYSDELGRVCRRFIKEMLPGVDSTMQRFPLRSNQGRTVTHNGREFTVQPNLFVLMMDMRNSTGARHVAPQLKVKIDSIIEELRQEDQARSHTTYDDCRVLVHESFDAIVACAARLHAAMSIDKTPKGFAGLRMGLTRGEMLFADVERFEDIRRAAALDSAVNTMARAARLMALDQQRWETSDTGKQLQAKLGPFSTDDSLIFFDDSIHHQLAPEVIATELGERPLRGFDDKARCWSARVESLAVNQ